VITLVREHDSIHEDEMGEAASERTKRNTYEILVRKPHKKRTHERQELKWETNIVRSYEDYGFIWSTGLKWLKEGQMGEFMTW
jgi:hypothetical protein